MVCECSQGFTSMSLKIDALMEQAACAPQVRLPKSCLKYMTQSKPFQIIKVEFALNTLTQLWNQQSLHAQEEEVVLSKTKLYKMLNNCSLSLRVTCIEKCKYCQKILI